MDFNKSLENLASAIRYGYRNWDAFSARSTRRQFWLWNFHLFLALMIQGLFGNYGAILFMLYFLIALVPTVAMWVRRIHDTGHRVWWCFIPGIGGLINTVLLLSGTNELETRWAQPGESRPTQGYATGAS